MAGEQETSLDRAGRCAGMCGDRTLRRPRHVPLDDRCQSCPRERSRGRCRIRQRSIQRSVWTGLRGSIRHDRQHVHVELHNVDISGSEGDRQQGVLYDIPEGDELDLGECHYNWRKRPRPWDGQHDQRNEHRGHVGHRATDWQRRICGFLGGRGGPLPARCTDHVKAGRSDPGELQSGVGDDRQRNDSE